jgi:Cu/Ag efflux pump CusA
VWELMWGKPAMTLQLKVDRDRANLSGVTNLDVALSSTAAMSGLPVSTYREGDKHFVTLLLVPALYSIFVLDLKLIRCLTKPIAERICHAHNYRGPRA